MYLLYHGSGVLWFTFWALQFKCCLQSYLCLYIPVLFCWLCSSLCLVLVYISSYVPLLRLLCAFHLRRIGVSNHLQPPSLFESFCSLCSSSDCCVLVYVGVLTYAKVFSWLSFCFCVLCCEFYSFHGLFWGFLVWVIMSMSDSHINTLWNERHWRKRKEKKQRQGGGLTLIKST